MHSLQRKSLRVLIVEDDRAIRRVLQSVFARAGHETFATHSVRNGLELLELYEFDALITDYDLPDGHGGQVLDAAISHGIDRRVLHSASSVVCDIEFAHVLRKPADVNELVRIVEGVS